MTVVLDRRDVRTGQVRGRYFRENFAQGGFDLVQVLPELVTNADAAIAAAGRERGRIELGFGAPDPDFVADWRRELRRLGVRGLPAWRQEVRCTDDGIGVDAEAVDARLGALGVAPDHAGQRGLFGRGLRDVWLAQGGGRIAGVRGDRAVESWFFPATGDDPYAYAHVRDEPQTAGHRAALGVEISGTRVTVPLPDVRPPAPGRLRTLVAQLVQLRPLLEDPARELWLELPGQPLGLVTYPAPEPDPERPVLADEEVDLGDGVRARITVRRAVQPIPLTPLRATRRGGLVVRSGRSAHEVTLVGSEGLPGARHLYGEVWCEAIEERQRAALDQPRPQLVVRADRTGLNEHHPLVRCLYAAIDRVVKPIVAAEERRAGAHLLKPGRAVRARDEVGLRQLNDALRNAFDAPGSAGFGRGEQPADRAPLAKGTQGEGEGEGDGAGEVDGSAAQRSPAIEAPIRFKQSLVRMHPGEQRSASVLFEPTRIPPGTPVEVSADSGLNFKLSAVEVPEPNARGWSRLTGTLRVRATADPGARLTVLAEAAGHTAELEVMIVRHRAAGWVREIARKNEDSVTEAHFDPEAGVVTVFEGRPEFRALERAARSAGFRRNRAREYLPFRMLEVEAAANAVYAWAAERMVERRDAGTRPTDPAEYARVVRFEAQALRHRVHEKLMRAFLEPEVFEGGVRLEEAAAIAAQGSLLDD
ncbi:MAG: hypothetical protein MSC31_10105 [Solirubrobacteraceae bacterium MAG38_C4-C5]|nr:hypothetical protein [Candidatus Siliceabacter maunaloa]